MFFVLFYKVLFFCICQYDCFIGAGMSRSECKVCINNTEFWWYILGHVFVYIFIYTYVHLLCFFACLFVCYCGSARVHPVFLFYCHQQGGSVKEQLAARSRIAVCKSPKKTQQVLQTQCQFPLLCGRWCYFTSAWNNLDNLRCCIMTLLPWMLHSGLASFHSRNRFEGFRELKKCQDLSDVLQALACQTPAWAHEGSTLICCV